MRDALNRLGDRFLWWLAGKIADALREPLAEAFADALADQLAAKIAAALRDGPFAPR